MTVKRSFCCLLPSLLCVIVPLCSWALIFTTLIYPEIEHNEIFALTNCTIHANGENIPRLRPYRACAVSSCSCTECWSCKTCGARRAEDAARDRYDTSAATLALLDGPCSAGYECCHEVCDTCCDTCCDETCTGSGDSESCTTSCGDCHCTDCNCYCISSVWNERCTFDCTLRFETWLKVEFTLTDAHYHPALEGKTVTTFTVDDFGADEASADTFLQRAFTQPNQTSACRYDPRGAEVHPGVAHIDQSLLYFDDMGVGYTPWKFVLLSAPSLWVILLLAFLSFVCSLAAEMWGRRLVLDQSATEVLERWRRKPLRMVFPSGLLTIGLWVGVLLPLAVVLPIRDSPGVRRDAPDARPTLLVLCTTMVGLGCAPMISACWFLLFRRRSTRAACGVEAVPIASFFTFIGWLVPIGAFIPIVALVELSHSSRIVLVVLSISLPVGMFLCLSARALCVYAAARSVSTSPSNALTTRIAAELHGEPLIATAEAMPSFDQSDSAVQNPPGANSYSVVSAAVTTIPSAASCIDEALPEDQRALISTIFTEIDENHDGTIDRVELLAALRLLGWTDAGDAATSQLIHSLHNHTSHRIDDSITTVDWLGFFRDALIKDRAESGETEGRGDLERANLEFLRVMLETIRSARQLVHWSPCAHGVFRTALFLLLLLSLSILWSSVRWEHVVAEGERFTSETTSAVGVVTGIRAGAAAFAVFAIALALGVDVIVAVAGTRAAPADRRPSNVKWRRARSISTLAVAASGWLLILASGWFVTSFVIDTRLGFDVTSACSARCQLDCADLVDAIDGNTAHRMCGDGTQSSAVAHSDCVCGLDVARPEYPAVALELALVERPGSSATIDDLTGGARAVILGYSGDDTFKPSANAAEFARYIETIPIPSTSTTGGGVVDATSCPSSPARRLIDRSDAAAAGLPRFAPRRQICPPHHRVMQQVEAFSDSSGIALINITGAVNVTVSRARRSVQWFVTFTRAPSSVTEPILNISAIITPSGETVAARTWVVAQGRDHYNVLPSERPVPQFLATAFAVASLSAAAAAFLAGAIAVAQSTASGQHRYLMKWFTLLNRREHTDGASSQYARHFWFSSDAPSHRSQTQRLRERIVLPLAGCLVSVYECCRPGW